MSTRVGRKRRYTGARVGDVIVGWIRPGNQAAGKAYFGCEYTDVHRVSGRLLRSLFHEQTPGFSLTTGRVFIRTGEHHGCRSMYEDVLNDVYVQNLD